jgi:hypothetical protein
MFSFILSEWAFKAMLSLGTLAHSSLDKLISSENLLSFDLVFFKLELSTVNEDEEEDDEDVEEFKDGGDGEQDKE